MENKKKKKKKKKVTWRTIDEWDKDKTDEERIKGRECHGQQSVDCEGRYGVKENHRLMEDFLIKKRYYYSCFVWNI